MTTTWRWLSRGLIVLLVGLLLLAAVWTYGRLTSPTDAQREAVGLMEAQLPVPGGDNGFDLLMDMPPAPHSRWPNSLQCSEASSCLDAAQSASAEDALLEPWRPRLEVAERALRAPAFRDTRMDVEPASDAPSFAEVTHLDTLRAPEFSSGQTASALGNACTDATDAARWAVEPDSVVQSMVGLAVFRQHTALISDMRRRTPSDTLPQSCAALADAPDAAVEGSFCDAMRSEWRFQQSALPGLTVRIEDEGPAFARLMAKLTSETNWQLAATAESFAAACSDDARAAAREDRVLRLRPPTLRWVDKVAYPGSVVVMGLSAPAYADYFDRQLDHVARRRLLAALLQMDTMDPALTPQQRFDALPAELRDGPRPLALAADGSALSVPIRARRGHQHEPDGARLPLAQAKGRAAGCR